MTPPTDTADHLVGDWHDLLERHARAQCTLERALKEHDLGVSEYEVLERLRSGECAARRLNDLGAALHLSQSALSRVVARLERDGLVERGLCHEDRRGVYVKLTDAGRERQEAAQPAHRAALAEALAS